MNFQLHNLSDKRLVLIFFIFASYFLIHASNASAQSFSVGVYPPVTRLKVQPGITANAPLKLYNLADKETMLEVILKPFTASGEKDGAVKYYKDSEVENFLEGSVRILDAGVPTREILLSPKQEKSLQVEISAPESGSKSDYYFSVIFLQKQHDQNISNNINGTQSVEASSQILGGVASNFLVSFEPEGASKIEIEEFSAPRLVNESPVSFKLRLKNPTKHFATPHGYILIRNMFGQTIGKIPFAKSDVLSESSREYTLDWKEKLLLGPYNAKLVLISSNAEGTPSGDTMEANNYFLAFPTKYLIIFAGFAIITSILYLRIRKRLAS